jgi:hypothetical protein
MPPQNKKVTRNHRRRKTLSDIDTKGERFFLQGVRWRFPSNIGQNELDARITRLRVLWTEHEAFCHQSVWIAKDQASFIETGVLDEAVAWLQQRSQNLQTSEGLAVPPTTSTKPPGDALLVPVSPGSTALSSVSG